MPRRTKSVKVSSRHQIALPRWARERLGIGRGDRLLVDVQDGLLILVPKPDRYTDRLAGLGREVWEGAQDHLEGERQAWEPSKSD